MATITLRAQKGSPLTFAEVDNNFNAINQELIALGLSAALKGAISNADIASNAGIADGKLATISSPGKVANSATSADSANTGGAIVLRDSSGNFAAGTITAALAGNASTATAFSGNRGITLSGAVTGSVSSNFAGNVSLATTLGSGVVSNASVADNAGIVDTKLDTISSTNKVAASAVDIDGAFDIGEPLSNSAVLLVDRTGAGENRKASVTRIPAYVFSKISGDVVIDSAGVATVTPAGKVDATDVFAQVTGDITISATGTASLAAGAIFNADINASAAIAHSKLASLLAGQVLLGNSSNIPTATSISGDISLSAAGVATLNAGVVSNVDIASDANIAFSKLAPLAAGQFLVGSGANVPQGVAISGDITINGSGAATLKPSIALTGEPTTPTPLTAANNAQIASTAFVVSRIAQDAPTKTGGGASGTWGIGITGNANTATTLQNARTINGVSFNGGSNITITANTPNSLILSTAGNGGIGGTTFNGSSAVTISYNSIGAAAAGGSNATGTWPISINGNAATVTGGVYTTGNQSIGGSKTFTEALNAAGRINITGNGASLRIGANRTASTGLSYIDLIAATGQDYGLRVVRDGGVNGKTDFEHIGSGDFRMVATNAAWYKVVTNGIDRFAVSSGGDVYINAAFNAFPGNGNTNQGAAFSATDALWLSRNSAAALQVNRNDDGNVIFFRRAGVGLTGNGIAVSGTQVNYVTSSDYRLKQPLGLVSDAIDRVLRVPVRRYTRDGGGELIHDGFFAHELQQVAPYAVTGERDAVDKAGQPIYQGVDLGKAVPLLWAAVQELIGQIRTFKSSAATL